MGHGRKGVACRDYGGFKAWMIRRFQMRTMFEGKARRLGQREADIRPAYVRKEDRKWKFHRHLLSYQAPPSPTTGELTSARNSAEGSLQMKLPAV
jgi:hypothetical protein